MSGVFITPRDKNIPYSTALANTNTTAVYAHSGTDVAKLVAMFIGNENGSTVVALVYWYDGSTEYCIGGYSVADDRSQIVDLYGMALSNGQELRVKANSGVDVTVIVAPFIGSG